MTDDIKIREITLEELGDPEKPQEGDPKELPVQLSTQDIMVIYKGLGEVPAKFSKATIDRIERQVRDFTLAWRREKLRLKLTEDAKRIAAAEDKRQKRQAKAAARVRVNGVDQAPAP